MLDCHLFLPFFTWCALHASSFLTDTENDELAGLTTPPIGQTAGRCRSFWVIVFVATNEMASARLSQQGAGLPFAEQEVFDGAPDVVPERVAIGLENRPLGAFVNRVLQIGEVAAYIDVLPFGIRADRARSPKSETTAGKVAEAVDTVGIENVLLRFVKQGLKADGPAHNFVGRRLEHTTLNVVARVNAGHETTGRQFDLAPTLRVGRIKFRDPWVIERSVFRIELAAKVSYLGKQEVVRRVEHGDAIAHPLAVTDKELSDLAGARIIAAIQAR